MKRNMLNHAARLSIAVLMVLVTVCTQAILVKEKSSLDNKEKFHQPFIDKGGSASLAQLASALPNHGDWQKLLAENGPQDVWLDPQTGRIRSVSGRIPWIPGMFNTLTRKDIAGFMTTPGTEPGIPELDRIAQNFITRHASLFRIPAGITYVLSTGGSSQGSPNSNMWNLRYDLFLNGVPINGGALIFVLKHGNLILWGTEGLDDVGQPLAAPSIPGANAVMLAASYMGGLDGSRDTLLSQPKLVVLPERTDSTHGYRQVWEVKIARQDEGTYLSRVDAATGEIIEFRDINEYAQVKGGIFPIGPSSIEVSRPLGFADFNAGVFADAGGSFVYPGGSVTSALVGRYVRISDVCGPISLSTAAAPGDLNFGLSAGNDCVTPGVGGAGNTHSARSCYYHTDQIKQKGRFYFPNPSTGFTWLSGVLQGNVNINNTCNANWNGTQMNFFRSGGGCGNTGEIAGVFLHEWGHGMDQNDGNGAGGSGEAMGDTVAMLQLRDSCIGDSFFKTIDRGCGQQANGNFNCGGYGNCCSNCSGVRDQDRLKHAANRIYTPATITGFCTSAGGDPCGREVHCEGEMPGNTVWDLAARDLPARPDVPTANDAWAIADKMWWVSGQTRNAAYTCVNKTAPPWNNGCGAASWYKTFLAADDDDGNTANGTPHAATVFTAFDRHGISCGIVSDPANTDQSGCAAIGTVGTLSGTPSSNTVTLNWSVATGAANYVVSRNNLGCGFGFTPIVTVTPGSATSYADTTASNGTTWYYNIQAHGTNTNCVGPISNCIAVTPQPCAFPGTPTIGTATVPGLNQVNVTWSQGAPVSNKFNVYRATGTCAAPGPFVAVTTGLPALPTNYTDNTVSGGVTYAFKVAGTETTGVCESAQSGCVQATATGTCTLAPTFAGATTATNNGTASCGVTVSWAVGTSNCAGPAPTYKVYRSTTTPFTPSGANQIATGIAGTNYVDTSSLVSGTAYYYIVRATDSLGNADANVVTRSTTPTGPTGGSTTYTSTDVPKAIPDNNPAGVVSNLTVAGNANIVADVNVTFSATHTWDGDLQFSLISPAAVNVALVTNRGGSADNFTSTVLDDSAAGPISGGAAPFTGTFRPEAVLTAVNAIPANGLWQLKAVDTAGADIGNITAWSLAITTSTSCTGCAAAPAMSTVTSSKSGVNLVQTWSTVVGASTYNVYRNTSPNTAIWGVALATGIPGLTYSDAGQLSNATSQFYSVTDTTACGSESPK